MTAAMPHVGVPPNRAVAAMVLPVPDLGPREGLNAPTWVRVWAMRPFAPSAKPWSRPIWP